MLPSASAAKNTALIDRSGDLVASAVATAALVRPPVGAALRFVRLPVKTPPAVTKGAPLRGIPLGSMTVIVPSPALPVGAFANHGRPKPLFNEMPSGRLTAGRSFVTAAGLLAPFRNAGLWAVYRMTLPASVLACPPPAAKAGGTTTTPPLTSSERMAPGASVGRARGAPKFDVLATKSRVRSSTCPGRVEA